MRLELIHKMAERAARKGNAKMIHLHGKPYLERYILRGGMAQNGDQTNFYLHRFHQPDDDRGPHSHPWRWSASLILWGGYVEERLINPDLDRRDYGYVQRCNERVYREGSINFIDMTAFHRISKLLPREGEVWTLFTTGPKHSLSWGYLIDGRYVPKATSGGCRGCKLGEKCSGC